MRKQDECGKNPCKLALSLFFTLAFASPAWSMSPESEARLNEAAFEAYLENQALKKEFQKMVRSRIRYDQDATVSSEKMIAHAQMNDHVEADVVTRMLYLEP